MEPTRSPRASLTRWGGLTSSILVLVLHVRFPIFARAASPAFESMGQTHGGKSRRRATDTRRKQRWRQCERGGVRTGVHGEVEQREPADDQAETVAGPSLTSVANINSIVPTATAEACHLHWNAAEPLYDPKRTQAALSDRVR